MITPIGSVVVSVDSSLNSAESAVDYPAGCYPTKYNHVISILDSILFGILVIYSL